jgi:hypothetical protein
VTDELIQIVIKVRYRLIFLFWDLHKRSLARGWSLRLFSHDTNSPSDRLCEALRSAAYSAQTHHNKVCVAWEEACQEFQGLDADNELDKCLWKLEVIRTELQPAEDVIDSEGDQWVPGTSEKQQISGGLSMLVWAFPLASQDQTRHENAKSMNCAMLGIQLLMLLFKYNSNIDIG